MKWLFSLLIALILGATTPISAFESDVHFGLTEWLALQAGYRIEEANAIAIGDQRVDSGDISYIQLAFAYACLAKDYEASTSVETYRFPSSVPIPAPPDRRIVIAGGDAARRALAEIIQTPPSKAAQMLLLFGVALHALQASWSNQGVPEVPQPFGGAVACDADSVWAEPKERGGWDSHRPDLTRLWVADTSAMAQATYEALQRFPAISGHTRAAKDWHDIEPQLASFTSAATKTEKTDWFVAHGIVDVSFLEGISLRDGAREFNMTWNGRRLPRIASTHSGQHDIDPTVLEFFDRFFSEWATTDHFDKLVTRFSSAYSQPGADEFSRARQGAAELAARFGLWRVRDHGRIATLVHSRGRFTHAQLVEAAKAVNARHAVVKYTSSQSAFFPLLPRTKEASPLVPFMVFPLAQSAVGNSRVIAVAKFRHAPYDTVAVAAERIQGHWLIVAVDSIVEH